MASESSDEGGVSLNLPAELDEWLDAKATELQIDRGSLVVQLLASYRAAEQLDDDAIDATELLGDDLEAVVRNIVADRVPDIAGVVADELDYEDDIATLEEQLGGEIEQLERQVDAVESDFDGKIEDVRERVLQVKREADAKAPADHTHSELEDVAKLRAKLEKVELQVDESLSEQTDRIDAIESDLDDLESMESRLDDVQEKLNTLGWVVSDLRDQLDAASAGKDAVERLKQEAARKDVDRAVCDNCDNSVDIALLSEPNCPHCEAAVNDVQLPGGLFGKPKLSVAKQLEPGGQSGNQGRSQGQNNRQSQSQDRSDDDQSNVPDAAKR